MNAITAFQGENRFLSNFWSASVELDGVVYPTVEHAYVAAKTEDTGLRKAIAHVERPGDVKRIGRTLTLRPDWDAVKLDVMRALIRQKFQHPDLRQKLLATGDVELVEGNTWGDVFWGVCRGRGENHLGKILMEVRAEIRTTRAA